MSYLPTLRRMSISQLRRERVGDVEQLYFELTGQSESRPARKADMIAEIAELRRKQSVKAVAAAREAGSRAERAAREKARRAFHAENEAAQRRNNAIFDDMPPVPLWGES